MTYPESVRANEDYGWPAFQRLAAEQQDQAYTLAYYLLEDEERATTALRVAFHSAYQDLARFRRGSFRSWLAQRVLAACRELGVRFSPRAVINRAEFPSWLAVLPFDYRVVIILVDIMGMDYEEVAQATGVSPKAVSHRLARARKIITYGE